MTDVTYSRRVEVFLDDPATIIEDIDRQLLHMGLALTRATREVETATRLGLKELKTAFGRHMNPTMLAFHRPDGETVYLDAKSVQTIHSIEAGTVALEMPSGRFTVTGELQDIAFEVAKAVNAW